MTRDIDVLTSPALTHLRDRWWDAAFTEFVRDTLRPQPGERVLEVGCGAGIAELMLGLLQPGGIRYFGVDINGTRLRQARGAARAIAELARVMRPHGRVLLVEPDNAHRYWFSAAESGMRAYEASTRFFDAMARETAPDVDRALGPHLPALLRAHGIDAIAIHLFPVTVTRLGAPVSTVWDARRRKIEQAVAQAVERAGSASTRALGEALIAAVDRYAAEGDAAGPAFVEIQHTMLFAVVGHRRA